MEENEVKKGEKGAWISISAYILLSIIKLIMGNLGNSEALKADGLNNLTDVIASVAVLIGLRISQKPADENHKYGHLRAETIASLVASLIMLTVGLQVVIDSFRNLYNPVEERPDLYTGAVALFSSLFMYLVYRYNLKLSKRIGSKALYSAAQDNRSDALVSIGAAIGIAGAHLGLNWLDSLAAAIVGIIICLTAWVIFKEAAHDLTDGFEVKLLKEIEETINQTEGVKFVKNLRARLHGNHPIVDVTIFVEPSLTVIQSHDITVKIEDNLRKFHNIHHTHVHVEPH
ncbi:MAG: cation diffusion facilitator family transporter [Bacillota bacterium]|jgi:cation diffusion facilitator family transporter|uniref:Transporter n=1 Tax=Cytobacillus oceanisediminis 2691 TaxID=1196031 RepID=A0A160MJ73_9BACI|nr:MULTISPECIES: cation diffusion facilitator family transporter [Bacillaceae]AND42928.1 transporter [Cytobacillus oceanisediminis 2691]MBN8202730.1 cation transporter [Bacillus sp. NTK034]MCM3244700.1 cation diffusion facilitator family transporter [Cytobacillus oceanisediminis]UQX56924.1 cation diffusion facilitator family transporter [Cytobacillus pseudoceanisediminis]USK47447.1 cation diffusion facilitator family transporter [Cytobacillus oceanisediminis]